MKEEKEKASEQIFKSNMMPRDIESFLDYTDENNEQSDFANFLFCWCCYVCACFYVCVFLLF